MRMTVLGHVCVMGLLVLASGPRPVYAQEVGTISVTAKIAVDPSIGGSFLSAGSGTINGAPVNVTRIGWSDSHSESSPLFVLDVGYRVVKLVDVIGGFEYGRAGSNLVTIGTQGTTQVSASFDPYQYWGLEGGARIGAAQGLYGSVTGGFRHVDSIGATLTGGGIVPAIKPVYDASSVPTVAFAAGLLFGTGQVGFGIEVGVKYAGALKTATSTPDLASVATAGARWSLPIGFVVRF
jgi:hypothetical protein